MAERTGNLPSIANRRQTDTLNFDQFSQDQGYRDLAMALLSRAIIGQPKKLYYVDIATGNGLGPQTMVALAEASKRRVVMFGIDPDSRAIRVAGENTPQSAFATATFIEGYADEAQCLLKGKIPETGVQLVSILDALHEIPAKQQEGVVKDMAALLEPGGLFVMNSAFTSIAQEGVESRWGMPIVKAMLELKGKRVNRERLAYRTPEEFINMMESAGLNLIYDDRPWIELPTDALVGIVRYPGFVIGAAMSFEFTNGTNMQDISNSLANRFSQVSSLPRRWCQWIAQKSLKAVNSEST